MYIDKYKVQIKGDKYHHKTDKRMKDQVLATYQSDEGMNIKALKIFLKNLLIAMKHITILLLIL